MPPESLNSLCGPLMQTEPEVCVLIPLPKEICQDGKSSRPVMLGNCWLYSRPVVLGDCQGQLDWVSSASMLCQETALFTVADFISLAFSVALEALSKRDVLITKVLLATTCMSFMVKCVLSHSWLFALSAI